MKNIVILLSGRGSNMEAIVRACAAEAWDARVAAVVSNRADAAGLAFAAAHGIATAVVDHTRFESRAAFDAELQRAIDAFAPDVVALAGFMRILTPAFVAHYAGRMRQRPPVAAAGLSRAAHASRGDRGRLQAGRCDGALRHRRRSTTGRSSLQAAVPVLAGDSEATLAARVLAREHVIYPRAVALAGPRAAATRPAASSRRRAASRNGCFEDASQGNAGPLPSFLDPLGGRPRLAEFAALRTGSRRC